MVEIMCHNCNKPLDIPEHVNPDCFDAEILCKECRAWWRIKAVNSKVERMICTNKAFLQKGLTADDYEKVTRLPEELKGLEDKQ